MIDHLGVSKAILTHVIFCHQEEATWYIPQSHQSTLLESVPLSYKCVQALE